ncbi:MAG: RNA-directed DNA polymerase [Treponema sp.]|nr:RNA-directed DNA polymerase [Treponema sp.]
MCGPQFRRTRRPAAARYAFRCARRFPWFVKLDVRRYFDSIRHDILKAQLCRIIKDCRCLSLLFTVIDGYSVGRDASGGRRGLPVGNLTSQFFANLYLSPLDHHILEHLHPSGYVRYMDDMLLFAGSREAAGNLFCAVRAFCSERLDLHLKEPVIGRCADGVPFLGWRVSPGGVRVLSRTRRRMRATFRALERDVEAGRLSEQEAASRAVCMTACRRL